MSTALREGVIGTHRYTVEAVDQLLVRVAGPMQVGDAQALLKLIGELAEKRRIYLLFDARNASAGLETRRYLIDNVNPEWLQGAVYFGASVLLRIAEKALAIALLLRSKSPYEVAFVGTEEEARAAVAQWRAKWK
jgi:hypothetical protein